MQNQPVPTQVTALVVENRVELHSCAQPSGSPHRPEVKTRFIEMDKRWGYPPRVFLRMTIFLRRFFCRPCGCQRKPAGVSST